MLTQESAGAAHPRGSDRLRRSGADRTRARSIRPAAAWGALAVLSVGLLLWVAPLGDVLAELGEIDPLWLIAAVGLELVSCASYVLVFRWLFEPVSRRSPGKLAWLGLGAGAVLPGGDVAGVAASCLLLHRDGAPKRWLVVRSGALLLLINGVGVAAAGVTGLLLLSGAAAGPSDLLLAGVPVLVSGAIVGIVVAIPFAVRRSRGRAPACGVALADAIGEAGRLLRRPDWRLVGAVGYQLLDMGALRAVCAATGHPPSGAALILAYSIGYLTSIVPVPAGVGVLDGGLGAALIVYGVPASAAVAAVLVYHALAVWMPAVCGLAASLRLRREHRPYVAQGAVAAGASRLPSVGVLASDRA
jgi:uncharacterized membrane protein YbhN (UPF0104 family)